MRTTPAIETPTCTSPSQDRFRRREKGGNALLTIHFIKTELMSDFLRDVKNLRLLICPGYLYAPHAAVPHEQEQQVFLTEDNQV